LIVAGTGSADDPCGNDSWRACGHCGWPAKRRQDRLASPALDQLSCV